MARLAKLWTIVRFRFAGGDREKLYKTVLCRNFAYLKTASSGASELFFGSGSKSLLPSFVNYRLLVLWRGLGGVVA
jgi:hypothetical protein